MKASEFRAAIAQYIKESEYKGHTVATLKNKRQLYFQFLEFNKNNAYCAETAQEFLNAMRERKLRRNTIRTAVRLLRALNHYLTAKKYLKKDFSSELIMPKEESKPLHLIGVGNTEAAIIASTEPGPGDNSRNKRIKLEEYRPALRFVVRTGIRNSELRSIRGQDLDLDAEPPMFYVHAKGGEIQTVPVPLDMLAFLRTRTHRKKVFNVSASILNDVLQRGCRLIGKQPISVHDLRHTFATHMLRRGVPIQLVSRILRHKNVLVTDKYYTHYVMDDLSRAMNANHDLIRAGITDDYMADYVRKALEQIGVNTNNIYIDVPNHTFNGKW